MKLLLKIMLAIAIVVGIVAFSVYAGGCSSLFEAPDLDPVPLPNPDRVAKCFVVIEGARWHMARGDAECKGWQPI